LICIVHFLHEEVVDMAMKYVCEVSGTPVAEENVTGNRDPQCRVAVCRDYGDKLMTDKEEDG
jgi:hypothetical protein